MLDDPIPHNDSDIEDDNLLHIADVLDGSVLLQSSNAGGEFFQILEDDNLQYERRLVAFFFLPLACRSQMADKSERRPEPAGIEQTNEQRDLDVRCLPSSMHISFGRRALMQDLLSHLNRCQLSLKMEQFIYRLLMPSVIIFVFFYVYTPLTSSP